MSNTACRLLRFCWLSLLGPGLVIAVGCSGEEGPARFQVSGTVTYDGQPVPAGTILFRPDGSQGNRGPAGLAPIKDGKYDTSQGGKGTVGGPHLVRIIGLDGKPLSDAPDGSPLFPDYTATIELPKEPSTHDFVIPAQ